MDRFLKPEEIPAQSEITDYTVNGEGITHIENRAVFVPGAAVGDVLQLKNVTFHKNYASAQILHVLTPSPDRISPVCPVFRRCGGCVFRGISYEAELRYKQSRVENALKRIGGLSVRVDDITGSELCDRYRNKAQYPLCLSGGKISAGFYARGSHDVIPCGDCLLQPEEFALITAAFCEYANENGLDCFDEESGVGLLRHLYIRKAVSTGEILVCVVINGKTLPDQEGLIKRLTEAAPTVKSIQININTRKTNAVLGETSLCLYGKDTIEDVLCGKRVGISPASFYQVNSPQAEGLYRKAAEYLVPEGKTVIDMYCGIGTIGLSVCDKAERVIGIEIVPEAAKDARKNARLNSADNIEIICADASSAAKKLRDDGVRPDAVILDPPRKGVDGALIETICAGMEPERVVYISCNPATLARDAALFAQNGYELISAAPFDLFPRTAHVECAALFAQNGYELISAAPFDLFPRTAHVECAALLVRKK